jgi:hypothetical protein
MGLASVSTYYRRTIHTDIVGLGSSERDDTGSVATHERRFIESDLPTVQTSSKIMFRRGLKTVKTVTQMCEI